jgi:hypothetical protein
MLPHPVVTRSEFRAVELKTKVSYPGVSGSQVQGFSLSLKPILKINDTGTEGRKEGREGRKERWMKVGEGK